MKARDLFELRNGPEAPVIDPPKTRPATPAPTRPGTAPAPPKRTPQFPNPFRRRERPTVIPKPKAQSLYGESRARAVVAAMLETKLYATKTPPYAQVCPKCKGRCGKDGAHAKCPNCTCRKPAQSVSTPAPPAR